MTRVISTLLLASAVVTASGQEPSVVAPQAYKKQFENEWVRVTRVHYAPFEKLPEHRHPGTPTIFVYLNDGGPVLFKQHGDAGTYAATRPPTKAGGFRIWKTSLETHVVENRSELPSDFLQVELLKTDIDPATFRGRFAPDRQGEAAETSKVEFDNADIRVSRVFCTTAGECHVPQPSSDPGLAIALSSSESPKVETGQTSWLAPGSQETWRHHAAGHAEYLVIQIKHGPR